MGRKTNETLHPACPVCTAHCRYSLRQTLIYIFSYKLHAGVYPTACGPTLGQRNTNSALRLEKAATGPEWSPATRLFLRFIIQTLCPDEFSLSTPPACKTPPYMTIHIADYPPGSLQSLFCADNMSRERGLHVPV